MADTKLSFNGTAVPTKTVSGSEVRMQLVREEVSDLVVDAVLNSQTAEITVYEDTDGDGVAENIQKKTIKDGKNGYTLDKLILVEKYDYWVEVEFTNSNNSKSAELNFAELTVIPDTVDDFEDGDMSEYSGASLVNVADGSPSISTSSSTVYQGSYSAKISVSGGGSWSAYSTSGLNRYPSAGETFRGWWRTDTNNDWFCMVSFGLQDTSNLYWTGVTGGGGSIATEIVKNDSRTQLGSTTITEPSTNTWHQMVITWKTDGTIKTEVLDSSGTSFGSLKVTDTTFTSGGIGFGVYDNNNSHTTYYDDWIVE